MAGQLWQVNALGGHLYSDELSDTLRVESQPLLRYRNMADVEDGSQKGLHAGADFTWNAYENVQTQGGAIAETQTMPETNFKIRQRSLTIGEFGNSVPYTGLLDDLSKHPLEELIDKVLKIDAAKTFDTQVEAEFAKAVVRVCPASGTSTTAVTFESTGVLHTETNNVAMNNTHVKLIVDEMKEDDIPPYDGDSYMALGRPKSFRGFKDALEAIYQYSDPGFVHIQRGEIGRYENCRFTEQTNIANRGWTNGKSDSVDFFGADTVMECLVIPEEMRGKIPTQYGRDRGVAWYSTLR